MIVDTHCHLSEDNYDNLDRIVEKMKDGIMITAGCDDKTNLEVIDIVNKYNNVYGVIGIHPTEIDKITEETWDIIENNINNPKIVGIGEIGLDYYWNKDNKDKQKDIFIRQIMLANKYNKPIVIHSREAIEDTYNIIDKYCNKDSKIILHCYSSSIEMAQKFMKFNIKFGVGGTITFKNNKKLQEVVNKLDLSYILLETDSPYLTPDPYRGKKNEPYNTRIIAQKIAEIKNINIEKVINITTNNAISQFDLDKLI